MSRIRFRISKNIKIEVIYDDKTRKYSAKLLFKFNNHNPNWLYLFIKKGSLNKIKNILDII